MSGNKLAGGVAHKLPTDLKNALVSDSRALAAWDDITPLARNEWICWTITVKQQKTRDEHVKRVVSELKDGKRRPCCWIGCIHRADKPLSQSVRWALEKTK
ncbi:hypothetical protein A3D14_01530 [Candidatus Saccharibacteria bacterium RIFCSPHIGHO2_02_FULL_47_12]|nr:MAG: hypothetical protein A3D14_01530 [Candidatus Saccharibacteria bacterium RIFCSPHIGHO2_02_FULL_47_12]